VIAQPAFEVAAGDDGVDPENAALVVELEQDAPSADPEPVDPLVPTAEQLHRFPASAGARVADASGLLAQRGIDSKQNLLVE
jgi:hypothetical protein